MQVITRGLKGLHLITRGLFSDTADRLLRSILRVDFSRGTLQTDFRRNILRADLTRDIIQTPKG